MNAVIDKILINKNVKPTAMRQLVFELLSKQETAIDLIELERQFSGADRSTLYRTLKTFVNKKVIHSIDDGSGTIKYAICSDTCLCKIDESHLHFYCTNCDKTYCLTDVPIPKLKIPDTFSIESTNLVIKGRCDECRL